MVMKFSTTANEDDTLGIISDLTGTIMYGFIQSMKDVATFLGKSYSNCNNIVISVIISLGSSNK